MKRKQVETARQEHAGTGKAGLPSAVHWSKPPSLRAHSVLAERTGLYWGY